MSNKVTLAQAFADLLSTAIALAEYCKGQNIAVQKNPSWDYLADMNEAIEQAKAYLDEQYTQQQDSKGLLEALVYILDNNPQINKGILLAREAIAKATQ